jgi:hypothetical protein
MTVAYIKNCVGAHQIKIFIPVHIPKLGAEAMMCDKPRIIIANGIFV